MVFAPSSPRVYTIYEPVIRLKGQAKTVVTQRPFSSKEVQSLSLEPGALRALLPTATQGLQSVLHKIGGLGTFVFLYARVGRRGLSPLWGCAADEGEEGVGVGGHSCGCSCCPDGGAERL